MKANFLFLAPGGEAWDRVWAQLAAVTGGDIEQRCGCGCHEVWQYMGTFRQEQGAGSRLVHEFRHRHNPTTGQRDYRQFLDTTNGAAR